MIEVVEVLSKASGARCRVSSRKQLVTLRLLNCGHPRLIAAVRIAGVQHMEGLQYAQQLHDRLECSRGDPDLMMSFLDDANLMPSQAGCVRKWSQMRIVHRHGVSLLGWESSRIRGSVSTVRQGPRGWRIGELAEKGMAESFGCAVVGRGGSEDGIDVRRSEE